MQQLLVLLAERDEAVAARDEAIASLSARVAELEAQVGRNSSNSSKPPSSDGYAKPKPKPRSLREKSGRRPGKQPGAGGRHLSRVADPDRTVTHRPDRCGGCGAGLAEAFVAGEQVRQVFDLPAVALEVTEHRAQVCRCCCGATTTAAFPAQATAPACYGPRVEAVGAYLLARQHLPVERAAEAMADCFGAPVSTGWLARVLPKAAERLEDFLAVVRSGLQAAEVAHFDETGGRVNGKLNWVHVACTEALTAYHLAPGRGKDSIDAGNVLPHFHGTAVHDGLAAYRRYDVTHALCAAHHLRELAGLGEETGQDWPGQLAELLVEIHRTVQEAKRQGRGNLSRRKLRRFRRRYRELVAEGQALNPPPPRTGKPGRPKLGRPAALLRRLDIYQHDVLRFATDFAVCFDNNQAERDVRMVKLQQKISGGWRSHTGAEAFLDVRSYLSTARKHGKDALDVLQAAFTGQTWTPAAGPAP